MDPSEPEPSHEYGPEHRLERLTFFSDAIFAIAITILVIDIRPPKLVDNATSLEWLKALSDLLPNIGAYALSFLTIGALWIRHHHTLSMLAKFSPRLLWPSLYFLMSIAFLPFSTAFMAAARSHSPVPYAFYSGSLFLAGLLKAYLTVVAVQPDLVARHVTVTEMKQERSASIVFPAAAFVALCLAFVIPGWNNLAMLLIAVFRRMQPVWIKGAKAAE
jgi:uncharacterized membrane protein